MRYGRSEGQEQLVLFLLWMLTFFGSILIHEMGHAWFFRKYGGFGTRIHLYGMGGYATAQGRFSRQQHLMISAAGPAVQIIAAAILRHKFFDSVLPT